MSLEGSDFGENTTGTSTITITTTTITVTGSWGTMYSKGQGQKWTLEHVVWVSWNY